MQAIVVGKELVSEKGEFFQEGAGPPQVSEHDSIEQPGDNTLHLHAGRRPQQLVLDREEEDHQENQGWETNDEQPTISGPLFSWRKHSLFRPPLVHF